MKILHILNDGPSELSRQVIDAQSVQNEVKVIELSDNKSYDAIIDDIFAYDRVISW